MGRYSRTTPQEAKSSKEINPVWRGLGFILIVLVFFMSALGARELANANRTAQWIPTRGGMDDYIDLSFKTDLSPKPVDLNAAIKWIPGYPFRISELIFFLAFLFLGFGLIWTFYAGVYRMVGYQGDPRDAPEYDNIRRRPRRR
jgi:hypothetical protein